MAVLRLLRNFCNETDLSCTILENNILKNKIEVFKSMFVMSNNSIKLYTKFGSCLSKFDHNYAQNLISGIFGIKVSRIFSSSHLELSCLTLSYA